MKENKKRGIFKPLGAFLLALIMVLTHVVGAMDVQAKAGVKKPIIKPVSIGATKVTGGNLEGKNKRERFNANCIIHVTVKDVDGREIETSTVSIAPKGGSTWEVQLQNELKKGYTVYAKQEFNGEFSDEASVTVKKLLADEYNDKLTMPTGEIWVEQYVANILNDDEKAEALDLLKKQIRI